MDFLPPFGDTGHTVAELFPCTGLSLTRLTWVAIPCAPGSRINALQTVITDYLGWLGNERTHLQIPFVSNTNVNSLLSQQLHVNCQKVKVVLLNTRSNVFCKMKVCTKSTQTALIPIKACSTTTFEAHPLQRIWSPSHACENQVFWD